MIRENEIERENSYISYTLTSIYNLLPLMTINDRDRLMDFRKNGH